MTKIKCDLAEQEKMSLCAEVIVCEKTTRKSISLSVVDEEGVIHPLGDFSAREVAKGSAAKSIGEVFPELLFEKSEEETELQRIQNQLNALLQTQTPQNSKTAMSIRPVHEEVCNYVSKHQRVDYQTIHEGKCRVRTECLERILKRLRVDWTVIEFAKALDKQRMLHFDKGRLQKWVTDSSGTSSQYRAYVFDVVFKRLEVQ